MKRPTVKALSEWYERQRDCEYTCDDCGCVGGRYYVQPIHPYYAQGCKSVALCMDCIGRAHQRAQYERKAEFDAMPRCEVEGCRRRGTWQAGPERVLLCGRHWRRAKKSYAAAVGGNPVVWLGSKSTLGRAAILEHAVGRDPQQGRQTMAEHFRARLVGSTWTIEQRNESCPHCTRGPTVRMILHLSDGLHTDEQQRIAERIATLLNLSDSSHP